MNPKDGLRPFHSLEINAMPRPSLHFTVPCAADEYGPAPPPPLIQPFPAAAASLTLLKYAAAMDWAAAVFGR